MKLIRESLLLDFKRGLDPIEALNLGKLKKVKEWLSQFIFSSQYTINQDFTIDIKGDFIILDSYITEIPDYIKINICDGYFIWEEGNLKNLIGCPRIVKGDFHVSNNRIEVLTGAPEIVEEDFVIYKNPGNFTEKDIRKICEVKGAVIV